MPSERLTKTEKQRILDKALQDKLRRQKANQQSREDRIANGRRRIEKWVPSFCVPEIRRLVAAVLAEFEAGQDPRLRRGDPLPAAKSNAPDLFADTIPNTATSPGTRGPGLVERRRAQTARRRERQRAAGLIRTTFDVPITLVARISAIIDQVVFWMSEGVQVILEKHPVAVGPGRVDQTPEPDPPPTVVAQVLVSLDARPGDNDERDISPLFEDVHAAARLEWGLDNESAVTEALPNLIAKRKG